jgi:hypothetical protein
MPSEYLTNTRHFRTIALSQSRELTSRLDAKELSSENVADVVRGSVDNLTVSSVSSSDLEPFSHVCLRHISASLLVRKFHFSIWLNPYLRGLEEALDFTCWFTRSSNRDRAALHVPLKAGDQQLHASSPSRASTLKLIRLQAVQRGARGAQGATGWLDRAALKRDYQQIAFSVFTVRATHETTRSFCPSYSSHSSYSST